eukprot:scaffold5037_cov114-Isochrysis_galbana.AAC.20
MPVTSGAPSQTTRSASRSASPSRKRESTRSATAESVMSPVICSTPSICALRNQAVRQVGCAAGRTGAR